MTIMLAIFAPVFKFFVYVLDRCPFCWNTRFIYETTDPGPDRDTSPSRKITRKTVCGACNRTITSQNHKASKHSP